MRRFKRGDRVLYDDITGSGGTGVFTVVRQLGFRVVLTDGFYNTFETVEKFCFPLFGGAS